MKFVLELLIGLWVIITKLFGLKLHFSQMLWLHSKSRSALPLMYSSVCHGGVRLPDVLERQGFFLNLLSKLVVLDPWKTFRCPWVFSGILESSWTVVKVFNKSLLNCWLNFQCKWTELRVGLFSLKQFCSKKVRSVIQQCVFGKMCYTNIWKVWK